MMTSQTMTSQTTTSQATSGLRPGCAVISSRTTPAGFPTAPSSRPASAPLLLAMGTGNMGTGNTSTGSVTPMADAVGGKPPRPREARPV